MNKENLLYSIKNNRYIEGIDWEFAGAASFEYGINNLHYQVKVLTKESIACKDKFTFLIGCEDICVVTNIKTYKRNNNYKYIIMELVPEKFYSYFKKYNGFTEEALKEISKDFNCES